MKRNILTVLIIVLGLSLNAQVNLDSLYGVWKDNTKTDSTRTMAFRDYIAKGYAYSKPDSAIVLSQELHKFGIEQDYKPAVSRGFYYQGVSHSVKGDYPKAIEYFNNARAVYVETEDFKAIGQTDVAIATMLVYQGKYAEGLNRFKKSLKSVEKINDSLTMSTIVGNIGSIYYAKGDVRKALDNYNRSIKILENLNSRDGLAGSYMNIGSIYTGQGEYETAITYYNQSLNLSEEFSDLQVKSGTLSELSRVHLITNEIEKSLEYAKQALQLNEKMGRQAGISTSFMRIASVYETSGDFLKALEFYNKAIAIDEEIGATRALCQNLALITNIYLKQSNYTKALISGKRAYDIALKANMVAEQKSASNLLYLAYKALGNGTKALEYFEISNKAETSLNSNETVKKIQQIEFAKQVTADSLATVEKERKVEMAHQEEVRQKNQTRNMLAGGGLIVLILGIGVYSRLRYTKKAKNIIEKEKDRSENLLLNILPAEIAEELKEKGKADARDFDMVSIIFTDFKGFTEQSEALSAADLVNEINVCFEAFDGIMETYDIEKIKTIGDAYMAAGGLPVPDDTAIKNTVLAALDMRDFIVNRKAEMDAKGKPAFEMRVGIHTGPVVAGIVGVKKFQYDIWGDTVNTASRMESSGEVGKVNISEASYQLLKDDGDFTFTSRGKIKAKGKGDIDMYFIDRNTAPLL
ncbi:adenylate/guanylate cyclase domain-containing protein [Winogradskyella sp. A2]|uniref:adenylate/guanylate cyclase domain-containing protein n=1 Tax=Winogradskyella sp. A2 TaxID=3366944 RepID=UPI00398C30A1